MHLQLQDTSQSLYVILYCGGVVYCSSDMNLVIMSTYNNCNLLSPQRQDTFTWRTSQLKARHSERPTLCHNYKCRNCGCLWHDLSQLLLIGTVSQIIYCTMRLLQGFKFQSLKVRSVMLCVVLQSDNLLLARRNSFQTTVGEVWVERLGCASGPAAPGPVACVVLPVDELVVSCWSAIRRASS
jgi:hypothetical protein